METHDPMSVSRRLREIREALLRLHRTLLDSEFAWLRPLSESVVRIDELLAAEGEPDEDAVLVQVRALASPDSEGTPYAQRYLEAIQQSPDAVLAHRDLLALLRRRRAPR